MLKIATFFWNHLAWTEVGQMESNPICLLANRADDMSWYCELLLCACPDMGNCKAVVPKEAGRW